MVAITIGGPISPAKAAIPPASPRNREPNTTDKLTMFGPGRKWHSAKVSLNSSTVIQRCWSTMPRRAQTRTPPKPASDILANATNSSNRLGWFGGGLSRRSGAGTAAGGESEAMAENLERQGGPGQPNLACSRAFYTPTGHDDGHQSGTIFLGTCTLYWGCRFAGYGNK